MPVPHPRQHHLHPVQQARRLDDGRRLVEEDVRQRPGEGVRGDLVGGVGGEGVDGVLDVALGGGGGGGAVVQLGLSPVPVTDEHAELGPKPRE